MTITRRRLTACARAADRDGQSRALTRHLHSDPIDAHLAVLAALRLDAGHLAVPRGAQPSFTAVPEALTISMLFPTVS